MSTKTAAKKPKLTPITITGKTSGAIGFRSPFHVVATLPTSILKELLRERGLLIPKAKHDMVTRLADWACRTEGTFTLTLQ